MSEKWVMTNFITGQDEILPKDGEGPSQWWIEGWEYYMHNGLSVNPYEQGTIEYWDWQDGHDAAERD